MNIDIENLERLPEIVGGDGLNKARRTCRKTKKGCYPPTCDVTAIYAHP
jgi:hypothetical protein